MLQNKCNRKYNSFDFLYNTTQLNGNLRYAVKSELNGTNDTFRTASPILE